MGATGGGIVRTGFALGIALSIVTVSAPVAFATDAGVLHACVHQDRHDREVHGLMHLVLPNERCRPGFARVVWNIKGPQGDPGPQGVPGPQGPAGGAGETTPTTALEQRVAALEAQVETLQGLLAVAKYLRVETGTINDLPGPHVIFEGANIHVRNGAGATAGTPSGVGNLVVGYNEPVVNAAIGYRAGSHNLVVGPRHTYTNVGGFVAGAGNMVMGDSATVSGGSDNLALGASSNVSGGESNTAVAKSSSVLGGQFNVTGQLDADAAKGLGATIAGGSFNEALGGNASVSGGQRNKAPGDNATVSGGTGNKADGLFATVGGGANRSAPEINNWVAGELVQIR